MKEAKKIDDFRTQLENHYNFPTNYLFKFIVPQEQVEKLKSLLPQGKISTKKSRTGKYVGVSFNLLAKSSHEIIDIYKEVYMIKGIISL